ncbi:hypothetical protein FBQ97_11525 [Acidobacteria bacterium ACD]|nr:MAG: hypothetical protein EDX89_21310 [Acidobacteriota bacterium]MCE7960297.1 hypothetical protein [Acidobacteria bacterium ACB2]MDL1950429.1 hypothetical protein [Acidobacteria bacterium ACD]
MVPLAERCRVFLAREVPAGLDYVSGSIAERVLAMAANGIPLDEELAELVPLCVQESRTRAEDLPGDARAYLLASADLLEEIGREGA